MKSKEKVYTSSDVLFSTESIGEEKKMSSLFVIRCIIFLRGSRFQPAYPICKSGSMLIISGVAAGGVWGLQPVMGTINLFVLKR